MWNTCFYIDTIVCIPYIQFMNKKRVLGKKNNPLKNLTGQELAALRAAERILRQLFPVVSLQLFGSKSRGTDDPESDIDLLVLCSRALSWQERDALTDALFDVELEYDVVISTLVTTAADWDEGVFSVLPIHEEIARDGIPL